MRVFEYKLAASKQQENRIDEAVKVTQFIRNKALRLWMDTNAKAYDLNRYCAVLAKEYTFANALNSQARQAASERTAYGISRYLKPDKSGKKLRKPQFQKNNRSVEYKTTGWKLSTDRLDMGLASFYTDSDGQKVDCPKFLRKAEKQLKREQRRLSRKKKGSKNCVKARIKVARRHLKVSRQRKDFAVKAARCVVKSSDFVALEDLQVRNLVKNRKLSKSIHDASWSLFANWLLYFGSVFGKPVVKVPPAYTSQDCSSCGSRVKKSLSERTHVCACGCVLDRDENAAKNILRLGLAAVSESLSEMYPWATGNMEPSGSATLVESAPLLPAHAG